MTSSTATPTTSQSIIRNIETNSNVVDLLEKIASLIDTCEFQSAHTLCTRALSIEPENTQLLETTGIIELELEMYEQAKKVKFGDLPYAKKVNASKYPNTNTLFPLALCKSSINITNQRLFEIYVHGTNE